MSDDVADLKIRKTHIGGFSFENTLYVILMKLAEGFWFPVLIEPAKAVLNLPVEGNGGQVPRFRSRQAAEDWLNERFEVEQI